jgi:tetratricopeptide (TPR) repeat protein
MCMLIALLASFVASAQEQSEIQIATEYVMKGEKEKALVLYQSLAKNPDNVPLIHNNYINLLLELARYKEAEDYVEKLIKANPGQILYRVDLGIIYVKSGESSKADRYFKSMVKTNADDIFKLKSISDYLASHNLLNYAEYSLQEARRANHNPGLFVLEMANLYRMQSKRDEMVEEYLNYVTQTPGNINYIKNLLQVLLAKPEELESLEKLLYDRVQQNPNVEVFADLLIWVNLQQKNFYGAFIQARAYDKRFHKETSKTLEIAQIALNNKDYENADKSFSYVVKEFFNTPNYLPGRLGLIQAREAKVKRNYPVNNDSVRYLIKEYNSFITEYPDNPNSHEAQLSEALLHAYYLDEKDSAIVKLNTLIANNKVSPYLKARAKLELGDIYLLMEESWESTLLYSQVEKSQRETPIGYEAKLRNAKLSYYKGEFKLAQEHLDILKQATTREIANDAMDLSMRIKENIAFDSTGFALKKFAAIELLLYQNKSKEALDRIIVLKKEEGDQDSIKTGATKSSTILDDVYWLEANLRMKLGEFEIAIALLQKILDNYGGDILADDAYFLQGEIYEEQLHNKNKAMEIYREFLNRFPGSVYAAEARKRFRQLRGDFVEPPLTN